MIRARNNICSIQINRKAKHAFHNFHRVTGLWNWTVHSLVNMLPASLSSRIADLRALSRRVRDSRTLPSEKNSLPHRLLDVFLRIWDLGFTAFGGPPVHFQILHSRFVQGKGGKEKWVDEQTVSYMP